MGKHAPCTVYPLRLPTSPYPHAVVRTHDSGHLTVAVFPGNNEPGTAFTLTRRDMRLLAKRINQCLDDTRS